MAVETGLDALRLTGTIVRLARTMDSRLRTELGDDNALAEITVLGGIDRGMVLSSELSRTLRIDPPRVTRLVDRLVRRGLVSRGADVSDRRRCPLALTPSGRELLSSARSALTSNMVAILDQLSEANRDYLVNSLEQVRQVLDR